MFESIFSMVNGDGLSAAASRVLEAQIAPVLVAVRAELLKRVTGTPPATFRPALQRRGIVVDDAQAQALWSTLIDAIADDPEQELLEPAALHA